MLRFVDKSGTAGEEGFSLGRVIVFAEDAGRADKIFSDLLPENTNKIHSVERGYDGLQKIVADFASRKPESLKMMNRLAQEQGNEPAETYGNALVATVKTGLNLFRKRMKMKTIGNVHLIIDANHHNSSCVFQRIVNDAKANDGYFRAVKHVALIDSAASRLLQLADVAAYSRNWILKKKISARELEHQCKIDLIGQ